jgi:TonB-dependent Receptor Plug Domain
VRRACVRGLRNGLGLLLVGAVLLKPLGAQVRDTVTKRRDTSFLAIPIPPGADSLLRDSLSQRNIRAEKRDSIKAPLAHSEVPVEVGIAQTLRWGRDSIYTTGAVTLADLLTRVPGVTVYHGGWIGAPSSASYLGDFRQVRVFYDGVELPVLDPRGGGVLDLTQINIWGAEEIVIEQAPQEVRVYIRTWRVRSTTSVTRTDVSTGDQQTNMYRGYFGKRYDGGGSLQFGAQQYGTTPPSVFGNSSDQLSLLARIGWANRHLSVDAFATHNGRHRGDIFGDFRGDAPQIDTIPTLESSRTDAYVRVATGDPDTSLVWGQLMASGSNYHYTGIRNPVIIPTTAAESALAVVSLDTTIARTQYIAALGLSRGPFHLSATERVYGGSGQTLSIPSVRASFGTRALVLSARAEARGVDSVARSDATVQLTPLSFVSLIGAAGRAKGTRSQDSTFDFTTNYVRGEAGVRLFNLWLLGGVLRRDSTLLSGPIAFNTLFNQRRGSSATGVTAAVRGQLWRLIHADLSAIRWNDTAFYRPKYQTRSELSIKTNLLRQFPSGDFGLLFSAVHEYRSGVKFPINGVPDSVFATGYRTISTLLEIRILSATISWQFRNLLGERYTQVPFFVMPRQTNFYGIRWEFYN